MKSKVYAMRIAPNSSSIESKPLPSLTPVQPRFGVSAEGQDSEISPGLKWAFTQLLRQYQRVEPTALRAIRNAQSIEALDAAWLKLMKSARTTAFDAAIIDSYRWEVINHFFHELVPPKSAGWDVIELGKVGQKKLPEVKKKLLSYAQVLNGVMHSYALCHDGDLQSKQVPPQELWASAANASLFEATTKGLKCRQLGTEYLPLLQTSSIQKAHDLYLVFRSFVVNAAKYTQLGKLRVVFLPGSGVDSSGQTRQYLMMQVSDTGIGIPFSQHQAPLSGKRAQNAMQSQIPGQAIGFDAARQIITQAGGSVFIQSPYHVGFGPAHHGTSITAYIPINPPENWEADAPQPEKSIIRRAQSKASASVVQFTPDPKAWLRLKLSPWQSCSAAKSGEQDMQKPAFFKPAWV